MRRAIGLAVVLVLLLPRPAAALSVTQTIPVGSQPWGVAAAAGLLYVTNNGGSTISVIDTATNSVVGSIAVGSGPAEIVADPAARRAYVGNFNNGTVSVVDTISRSTIATLSPGGLGVAVDPGLERLYMVVPSQVSVIDTTTLQSVATIAAPSGTGWWSVAVDPQRHLGYLGDLAGHGVTVVDLTTNAVLTTVDVGGPVRFALATDPARGLVFAATDTAPGRLSIIDESTNLVVRTATVGDFPSHIAPTSGTAIYVTDLAGGDLATVDTTSSTVTRIAVGSKPAGLAVAGSAVYVALNGANSVAVLSNNAPVVDSVTVSPSDPKTNDTLTASVTAHDADGDPLTYAYQWTKNGTDLSGATTLTLDLSVPGNGDLGDTIAFRVTVSDGTNTTTATSQLVVVADTAPVVDSVTITPSSARTNDVLMASASGHDADSNAITFAYQWTKNGSDISGATSAALDLSAPGHGDRGDSIAVRVTASDGSLTSPPVTSAPVVIADSAPIVSVSLNTTTPMTQTVLVATATASDADADPLTFTYVWRVNGVTRQTRVTAATSDSLDLRKPGYGNRGDLITVEVTASDSTLTATASANATVIDGRP